eukprot:gene1584-32971_t
MGAYGDAESGGLLLTSTRNEVKLWQTSCMLTGAVATWEGTTKGRFNHAGTQAYIYDIRTREKIATLKDSPQAEWSSRVRLSLPGRTQQWLLSDQKRNYISRALAEHYLSYQLQGRKKVQGT